MSDYKFKSIPLPIIRFPCVQQPIIAPGTFWMSLNEERLKKTHDVTDYGIS